MKNKSTVLRNIFPKYPKYSDPAEINNIPTANPKAVNDFEFNGKIKSIKDFVNNGKFRKEYYFNSLNLITEHISFDGNIQDYIETYKYDQNQNIIEYYSKHLDTLDNFEEQSLTKYIYNSKNQLIEKLNFHNEKFDGNSYIHYDGDQVVERIIIDADSMQIQKLYQYNKNLQLVKHKIIIDHLLNNYYDYIYDIDSNIAEIVQYNRDGSICDICNFEYEINRIKSKIFKSLNDKYSFKSDFEYDISGYSIVVNYNNGEYSYYRFNNFHQEMEFKNFDKDDKLLAMRELIVNPEGFIVNEIAKDFTGNRFSHNYHYSNFDNYGNWRNKTTEFIQYGSVGHNVYEREIEYYI